MELVTYKGEVIYQQKIIPVNTLEGVRDMPSFSQGEISELGFFRKTSSYLDGLHMDLWSKGIDDNAFHRVRQREQISREKLLETVSESNRKVLMTRLKDQELFYIESNEGSTGEEPKRVIHLGSLKGYKSNIEEMLEENFTSEEVEDWKNWKGSVTYCIAKIGGGGPKDESYIIARKAVVEGQVIKNTIEFINAAFGTAATILSFNEEGMGAKVTGIYNPNLEIIPPGLDSTETSSALTLVRQLVGRKFDLVPLSQALQSPGAYSVNDWDENRSDILISLGRLQLKKNQAWQEADYHTFYILGDKNFELRLSSDSSLVESLDLRPLGGAKVYGSGGCQYYGHENDVMDEGFLCGILDEQEAGFLLERAVPASKDIYDAIQAVNEELGKE